MAGKEEKPGGDPEVQYGPKGDSLAEDLDNRREVTDSMLLGGHPNLEEGAPAGGETDEEKAAREAAEAEAAAAAKPPGEEGKPPEKKEEEVKPKFKYASQEEAEKAETEAERKMHEATTAAAEEKRKREAAEAELARAREKPPEKVEEKPPAEKPPKLSKEELRTRRVELRESFLERMWALDTTDPTYKKDLIALMAEMDETMMDLGISASQREADIGTVIKQEVKKQLTARDKDRQEEDLRTARETAWNKAVAYGLEAGLNLNDADSADIDLFEAASNKLPDNLTGKGFTKEVGEWMVNYVRTRTGKVALSEAEKEAAAKKAQELNQPLGKGGGLKPKPKPEEETPGSLREDFEEARGRRIL